MEKRKIWIVTELFYPEETAVAYIFTRIANHLAKDYEVHVLCGPVSYDKEKAGFSDQIELSDEVIIYRESKLIIDKNNLAKRTLRLFVLSFQLANSIRKRISKGDIVLLATNPAPLLIFAGLLKGLKKFQLHILVHDVFPENTIPAGVFKSKGNLFFKLIKSIFDLSYSRADHLIVLGRDMKEIIRKKISKRNRMIPVSIVTNWTNTSEMFPKDRSLSLIKNWGLEDKIVLQYAGNVGRVQGLIEVVEAIRLCSNKNLHLVIHGSGAMVATLRAYIAENNISNISFFGSYSRNAQNEILNSCDISVVSLSQGMYGLGVPSKAYHILAAGKPILFLGDLNSEIACLVKEENVGWAIDLTNKDELISFLNSLNVESIEHYRSMGLKGRLLVENKYQEKIVLDLFQRSMESFFKDE